MSKLKPCPFCWSDNVSVDMMPDGELSVQCGGCGANVRFADVFGGDEDAYAEAWNCRRDDIPDGVRWPRYEDGALVRLGDRVRVSCGDYRPFVGKLYAVTLSDDVTLHDTDGDEVSMSYWEAVERMADE